MLRNVTWLMERLGIRSRGTIGSMLSRRQIPFIRLSPRAVRFDPAEIERWIEERKVSAIKKPQVVDQGRDATCSMVQES